MLHSIPKMNLIGSSNAIDKLAPCPYIDSNGDGYSCWLIVH